MKYFLSILILASLIPFLSFARTPEEAAKNLYLQYHPPREKKSKNDYPFPGPVIQYGQDIPVCDFAKTPDAYKGKSQLQYIIQGKDGWLFRTADFRSDFTVPSDVAAYIKRLNQALEDKNQTLLVAFQPARAFMESAHIDPKHAPPGYDAEQARAHYKKFLQQLNDIGVKTVDLSDPPKDLNYFLPGDFHWTTEGSSYAANRVAEAIKKIPAYAAMKKQSFESEVTGLSKPMRGRFQDFLQTACKTNIQMAAIPLWATAPAAGDADALLGNAESPAITVLGASNSAQDEKYDFIGALKRLLRTDIYNAAVVGGGFGLSAIEYYASQEYHAHPPKIIVWEFLSQNGYDNVKATYFLRQMIPAIYGACNDKDAIATDSQDIAAAKTAILSQAKNKSLRDAYLYVSVKDPEERNLKIEILYANGDVDQIDLTRATRVANNGEYYFELAAPEDNPALFFRLITDKPQGHVDARLCLYPAKAKA